jgi:N-acetylglucosamine kinase-like BadF-type ATPase
MTVPLVLAVDGGNFKTDLALVRANGEVLALVRGPQSSPHHVGVDGCVHVLEDLLAAARRDAGLSNGRAPIADVAQLLLAGVDFPTEEDEVHAAASERRLATNISVGNDTFAVLRAGTERGWGVAIVCGGGINCVGVAPDGRQARFPALGAITGDWGGGHDVGLAGVFAAARSEEGSGPRTSLEQAVPGHFGLATPSELAEAIHRGRIARARITEVAPIVLAEAGSDRVAAEILDRLAAEIVALTRVALERLELIGEHVEVLLGGGLIQADGGLLVGAVARGMREVAPEATVHATSSPPIVGAALLGLDQFGAGADAQQRLRRELADAFSRIDDGRKRRG